MKFEISNPSDACYLEADDQKIATACILFLGNGQYPTVNVDTGEQIAGSFFIFGGDIEQTWKHFHGIGLDEFMSTPGVKEKMAECFESFRYKYERTSMNNIGARAKQYAIALRNQLNQER